MNEEQIVAALNEGAAEAFVGVTIDPELLGTDAVKIAMAAASKRFVWHRTNYREALVNIVELGAPCEIWTAARAGLLDIVKRHVEADPKIASAQDRAGCTPLQRAALVYGRVEECEAVVDYLVDRDVEIDIFTAATFCLPKVVASELARDPELVKTKCQGSTPLNWAVRPRRNMEDAPGIVAALIDAGANFHDADEYESGMTPLHHAAEWGPKVCLELASQLIDAGADMNREDENGWTPLDYANDRQRKEMIDFLVAKGATTSRS